MFHEIVENDEGGLELHVEGGLIATIRLRHGTVDLVWQTYGPQNLDKARKVITALPDLLVQYDLACTRAQKRKADKD